MCWSRSTWGLEDKQDGAVVGKWSRGALGVFFEAGIGVWGTELSLSLKRTDKHHLFETLQKQEQFEPIFPKITSKK